MKTIHAIVVGSLAVALAGSVIAPAPAHAQGAVTQGNLRGVVRDKSQKGEPVVGATVVAISPALQGQQVVLTDDSGQYFITSLPPGLYTLTIYIGNGDTGFSRPNVLIQVGKEAVVNVTIDTAALGDKGKGEVITIEGSAPIVDQGSQKIGLTITEDYTRNIPVGRTFGDVLTAAAGTQADRFGISFGGSTSVENTYIVEGINTTDTAYGQLSSNLPSEFLSETEVITGGYDAEYGRSTGGVVNVVTKQGSNEFHGSVFGYYAPGALTASSNVIKTKGGSIDTKLDTDAEYDLGAEVGGPLVKDRLWFHIGFNPQVSNRTLTRIVQRQTDVNNTGQPDLDADGFPIHEEVNRLPFHSTVKTYYFTGKLTGAVDQYNQGQLSVFGNPSSGDQFNSYRVFKWSPLNSTLAQRTGAYDVAGKWTSKFNGGKTQIDAVFGYHHAYLRNDPDPGNTNQADALTSYAYSRSLYDFQDLEGAIGGCDDKNPNNPYPRIQKCPVLNYAESGLGILEHRNNDRYSGVVSVTQRAKVGPLGYMTLKAGVDYELSTYDSVQTYTGGEAISRACDVDMNGNCTNDPTMIAQTGQWTQNEYYRVVQTLGAADQLLAQTDPKAVAAKFPNLHLCAGNRALCDFGSNLSANTRDRSIGAFLQDSWQIDPSFTVNFGVRYEQQQGNIAKQLVGQVTPTGEVTPKTGFSLDNWAPRIGFNWDPTREGHAKIFGHYGRFYENVPMDLNVRSFGGEIDSVALINAGQLTPGSTGYNPACNVDHTPGQSPARLLKGCNDIQQLSVLGGGFEYVAPNLQGQFINELVVGGEYEPMADLKVGAFWSHRSLGRVIEDTLTPNGEYFIVNPARDYSTEASALDAEAAQLAMSGNALDKLRAGEVQYRADQLRRIKKLDPPIRDYDAVTIQIQQRPTRASLVNVSYSYSKERGNYPGLFSTETLQLDPNITSQYDLPALLANRYGLLGLDRSHLVKVDAFYRFDLKTAGLIIPGIALRAQSGIPHNALGNDPVYGQGESYLLPRGTFARSPVTTTVDVKLQYGYKLGKDNTLSAFVDIFNLFNSQAELNVDETYTLSGSLPIVGGDANDLRHLKQHTPDGVEQSRTVVKNPNFGHLNSHQAPRSIRLGMRLTF